MTTEHTGRSPSQGRHRTISYSLLTILVLLGNACTTVAPLPAPRSLIIHSGTRVMAEKSRLSEIDIWVRAQQENIITDPSFWIIETPTSIDLYPWDGLTISADTAFVLVPAIAPESGGIIAFYGHYHLMNTMGRLGEFLPEAVEADGYELEKAILTRIADAWLYGRSLFDMTPFGPLDEIMYANENGFLEAFILTSRPSVFMEERSAWLVANPRGEEEYRKWFLETFESEPPGLRQPPN